MEVAAQSFFEIFRNLTVKNNVMEFIFVKIAGKHNQVDISDKFLEILEKVTSRGIVDD